MKPMQMATANVPAQGTTQLRWGRAVGMLSLLIVVALVAGAIGLAPDLAWAATSTQDGITAEITTDKASYSSGDTVAVTVDVTNTNSFAVSNIRVEVTLPAGLTLKSGSTRVTYGTLAAGETRQLALTATAAATDAGQSLPPTGDDSTLMLWAGLLIALTAASAMLCLFRRRKARMPFEAFSLLLCLALILPSMTPIAMAAAVEKSFSANEAVTILGESKTISAKVTYDWDAPTVATYSITMADDGNGTASAYPASAAAGMQVTITATPDTASYQFKQWVVVSGGAVLSSTTDNPATFTMPASAVQIRAEFEPTAAALADADAEAAKITGFTAGTNNASNLVFNATGYSSLSSGATLTLVDIKTGAASPGAATDLGASLAAGTLSLNTQKTVDAADLTYVSVTFTATLNGVTSDPVTLDLSALFGTGTTADKLRADKAKFTGMPNTGLIGPGFTGNCIVSNPTITLSSGVSVPSTAAKYSDCGVPANTITVFADDGGSLTVNYSQAPTAPGGMIFDIPLNCAGTVYVISFTIVQPDPSV